MRAYTSARTLAPPSRQETLGSDIIPGLFLPRCAFCAFFLMPEARAKLRAQRVSGKDSGKAGRCPWRFISAPPSEWSSMRQIRTPPVSALSCSSHKRVKEALAPTETAPSPSAHTPTRRVHPNVVFCCRMPREAGLAQRSEQRTHNPFGDAARKSPPMEIVLPEKANLKSE